MSSPDSTKKRRVAAGNNGGGGGVDNNGVDDGITMSTILAKLNDMQNEMNGMKNELDKCISSRDSVQEEMDGMQTRLSHMDELEKKCDRLEKRCTNLDIRCESLQRSVQILGKVSKWEYSAPPIPLSHWRGFDEGYIEEMTSLLSNIKSYTCRLRKGEALEAIYFGGEDLLQHDDILLPHWKELTNALQIHQYADGIPELSITNVQLTSQVLDLLTPALKGKHLMELILDNNDFEVDKGTKFTTECIKHNNELQHFDWINNQIVDTKEASDLVKAIINHPSITQVRLENCLRNGDMNSYEVLRPIFAGGTKNWIRIDLESNNIQTKGDTAIPDYIASNPSLKNLFLAGNKLNDNDATLIASALKGNTNLERLRLDLNDLTDIGKDALSKAVYDPTSLNSVSGCNHTCNFELDGIDKGWPPFCNNTGPSNPRSRRSMKIHYVLSLRHREGSNVKYLNAEFDIEDGEDDSLKLAPNVLESVHKYYQYHDIDQFRPKELLSPLSIMYEVLRGWKMPELYEKRS